MLVYGQHITALPLVYLTCMPKLTLVTNPFLALAL